MNKTVPPGAAILLDFVREAEVGRGDRASYDVIYGNNQDKLPRPITSMTLDEVEAAQAGWSRWFGSSAAGGYQFMKNTLDAPRSLRDIEGEMGLSGKERFTPDLQDRMAYHLLKRRGYQAFIAGRMSRIAFGKRLAQEWASLPVLADTRGAKGRVRRGQSYYAGDGRNRALVGPEAVEAVMERALAAARRAETPEEVPIQAESPVRPQKPIRKSGRFWTWLLTAGGSILTALKELNLVALDWRVQLAILTVIVGFAAYAITSMPAVRRALGVK
ncbi:Flagellar protein FlgJ [peptidoglycan hydrolase] [Sinorhizobium sojae CCBAU 05684]|uniref:Flagellar protein FlgJ [peptidoglycan hydrolase] n=1 Tax=Sinorhizobium sojae CCBAU 05684 TaxID=716928 RepID=A0A249PDW7_9HYPH|nr:membrane protein [Sinorhizobium sojae]ASY63459.1 Flagellar protein FlgJ [peptidoglycan hydrolase] [Sinorhizobium sojae CCBAU 05684]